MDSPIISEHSEGIEKNEGERGFRLFRKVFFASLLLCAFALSYFTGYEQGSGNFSFTGDDSALSPEEVIVLNKNPNAKEINFGLFWKTWDVLKEKYVDKTSLDARKMLYGAIDGMLASTGDPYTTFFDPEENRAFREDIAGSFEGIGAEMGMRDDILTVIAPLEGTPSERAGILAGDRVLKINGEPTNTLSLDESVKRIRGPKGTTVVLSVFRNGDEEAREIPVTREVIRVKSVRYEKKEGDVAYIKINQFGEDTTKEFRSLAATAVNDGARSIILDLRNNPGGLLDSAVDIAGYFLPSGTVAVFEENAKKERRPLKTSGEGKLLSIPVFLLINEGSASASEILAGALRENREDVRLIGTKTFGKGSVQELVQVTPETSVKITVARWLTPKGNQINKAGITPDVEVKLTHDDIEAKRDAVLEKALELAR